MDTMVRRLRPPFLLAKFEGDASTRSPTPAD
jgi:hypothetical protein